MKKRILCFALALLTIVSFSSLLFLTSSSEGTYFVDGANVLTSRPERAQDIESRLSEISAKYNCPVTVITVNGETDATFERYAINYANRLDELYGKAVLLAHFPDIRAYQIEIRGSEFAISNVERAFEMIKDAVLENLKDENYYGAYKAFATKADYCLELLIAGKTVRKPYPVVRNVILILIAALIVALIYTGKLRKQLKTVQQQNKAANYVVPDSLNLTMQNDIFLYMHTTRTARPKSSSSGGGGFSSGGGRSSGGGGGGHY